MQKTLIICAFLILTISSIEHFGFAQLCFNTGYSKQGIWELFLGIGSFVSLYLLAHKKDKEQKVIEQSN